MINRFAIVIVLYVLLRSVRLISQTFLVRCGRLWVDFCKTCTFPRRFASASRIATVLWLSSFEGVLQLLAGVRALCTCLVYLALVDDACVCVWGAYDARIENENQRGRPFPR